ncbi:aldehyde dehydrogenase domain-containing protein [Aspergillus pseudoustus]|uniref:aldehyde dehydrogenase (NAD(+)) n=1 Tax=Aspergillus pseudoustus TaxID=1810923 RepID=A0ABR4J6J0_9EURO
MSQYESRLFINGELVAPSKGNTFPLLNPATSALVADIPIAEEDDIDRVVAAAEKAQPAWARLPARKRAAVIRKFADLMDQNKDRLSELDSVCMGKPLHDGLGDVQEACDITNYFAGLVELADGETSLNSADTLNISMRQPYGVVASIIPWNFPTMIWCHDVIPAAGAGNAVILKTSEKAPLGGVLLAQLAFQAGFPPGIINVVSGPGQTGALLSAHMRIRKISFTGSTGTGRAIMQNAAKSNLKAVSLELGGKSPLLVFDDADLPKTAAAAVKSITFNSGQICTASSRVYVQKGVAADFKKLVAQLMLNLRLGDPTDAKTNMGPQADSKQAAAIARFLEAGAKDGQALVGGKPALEAGENFIHPTVFANIPDKSKLDLEEIFGPVMVLHEFDTEEEAVRRANDTEYGLYASVFTKDGSRALRVARALEAGNVGVNCTSPDGAYELPFGGWKASGIGSQKGSTAVLEWTQAKSVYINHAA